MPSPLDQPESSTPSRTPAPDDQPESASAKAQRLAIEYDQAKVDNPLKEAEEEEIHTLDVGEGQVVKLDKLGPMIINSDGTLSRIQNWQDLHPIEQERTVRLLVKKRNLVRLQRLDADNKDASEEPLSALKEAQQEGAEKDKPA